MLLSIVHRRKNVWISFYNPLLTLLDSLGELQRYFTAAHHLSPCSVSKCDVTLNQRVHGSSP